MNRFNLNVVFGANVRFKQFNRHRGYRIGLIDQIKRENGTLNTSGIFVGLAIPYDLGFTDKSKSER